MAGTIQIGQGEAGLRADDMGHLRIGECHYWGGKLRNPMAKGGLDTKLAKHRHGISRRQYLEAKSLRDSFCGPAIYELPVGRYEGVNTSL